MDRRGKFQICSNCPKRINQELRALTQSFIKTHVLELEIDDISLGLLSAYLSIQPLIVTFNPNTLFKVSKWSWVSLHSFGEIRDSVIAVKVRIELRIRPTRPKELATFEYLGFGVQEMALRSLQTTKTINFPSLIVNRSKSYDT